MILIGDGLPIDQNKKQGSRIQGVQDSSELKNYSTNSLESWNPGILESLIRG